MGNLSAVGLVVLSYVVLMVSPTFRRDRSLLMVSWFTLTFRHALAFVNAFVTPLSSSWGDLYVFHNVGAGILKGDGFEPYCLWLRVLYKCLGVSFWLGEEASVFVYALSLLVFAELSVQLGVRSKLNQCVLLFGLMPSPAIHCSVTFRESYQVLGLLGAFWAMISLRQQARISSAAALGLSLLLVVYMHQSLAVYAVIFICLGIPWALQGKGHGGAIALALLMMGPLLLPGLIGAFQSRSRVARVLTEGDILSYASSYRENINNARSDYGVKLDVSDPIAFFETLVIIVFMYFLAPLPWQFSALMDYYAFFEAVVRCLLFFGFLAELLRAPPELMSRRLFVFLAAFSLELMWSIGTTNWGTALRHHVVAFAPFVLLGMPYYRFGVLNPELEALLHRRARRQSSAGTLP